MCGFSERTAAFIRDAAQPIGCGVTNEERLFIFGINLSVPDPETGRDARGETRCRGRAAC
jgi:hypothetical protein